MKILVERICFKNIYSCVKYEGLSYLVLMVIVWFCVFYLFVEVG